MTRTGRKTVTRQSHGVWWAIGAFVAVAAVIVLVFADPAPTAVSVADDPSLGADDAPLTIALFADFQCPYCAALELDGPLARLEAEYVEPGQVRIVFKDFPIVGDDSWTAAQASQAVWETTPELYWQWHRGLFAIQGPERSGWADRDHLISYSAGIPGIDVAAVTRAIDAGDRQDAVGDRDEGTRAGVRGTPTFVIAGAAVSALDESAVRAHLDRALASIDGAEATR